MFQPHSVRGLLSRRSNTRAPEEKSELEMHKDPDLQSAVQAKLMIKDIEHQIDDIRKWREHQKTILNQRLASNKAVAEVMIQSYQDHTEKEEERSQEQTKKLIDKLQNLDLMESKEEEPSSGDTNIFDYITNSNKWVEQMKHEREVDEGVSLMAEQNMMSEVQGLSDLMFKNAQKNGGGEEEGAKEKEKVDKDKLKKELEQIDAELREVQELLKE